MLSVRRKIRKKLSTKVLESQLVEKLYKKESGIMNRLHVNRLRPGSSTSLRDPVRITSKIGWPLTAKARPLLILPNRKNNVMIGRNILTARGSKFPSADHAMKISGEITS